MNIDGNALFLSKSVPRISAEPRKLPKLTDSIIKQENLDQKLKDRYFGAITF